MRRAGSSLLLLGKPSNGGAHRHAQNIMNNRFFFRCSQCLFRFAADVEGLRPPVVGACPVCSNQWVKCLGATKGVLSIGVPCNDKCVFAEGPDCSCSCAGRNHGSRLLVPVIRDVVDFKRSFPRLDQAARLWSVFNARINEAREVLAAREHTGAADVRAFLRGVQRLLESQSWDHRKRASIDLFIRHGVKRTQFSALSSLAPVSPHAPLPVEETGELFAWGEKWAEVSPQFRGHQFVVPDVDLGGGNIVRGVSFSPS